MKVPVSIVLLSLFLSACSYISVKSTEAQTPRVYESQGMYSNLDISVRWFYAGRYNDISDSKTGRELSQDVRQIAKKISAAGISKLEIIIDEIDFSYNFNPGFAGPGLLPVISSGKVRVTWKAISGNGSETKIIEKAFDYKEYAYSLFLPYGLVMAIVNPLIGEWDSQLGFVNNFLGTAKIDRMSVQVNKAIIADLLDGKFKLPAVDQK